MATSSHEIGYFSHFFRYFSGKVKAPKTLIFQGKPPFSRLLEKQGKRESNPHENPVFMRLEDMQWQQNWQPEYKKVARDRSRAIIISQTYDLRPRLFTGNAVNREPGLLLELCNRGNGIFPCIPINF